MESSSYQPDNAPLPTEHPSQQEQPVAAPPAPMQPQTQPQPVRPFSYPKPKKSKAPMIVLIVIVVLALAGGAYWFFTSGPGHKKDKAATSSGQTKTGSSEQTSNNDQGSSELKTFKSDKLGLGFSYRSDWKAKENADKSEIIITSPSVTYSKKDGTTTKGVFTVKMRNGLIPDGMKPTIQNAVAIKASEVIAYTAPTEQQRQYTNLSFGGSGTNLNFFIVTGSVAFKANETFATAIDLQGSVYLFAGGYGTDSNDTLSFDAVPQTEFTTSSVYKQALALIESLKVY